MMSTSRRTFVNRLMGTSVAAFLGALFAPVMGFLAPPASNRSNSDIVIDPGGKPLDPTSIPEGGSAFGTLADQRILVIRTGGDDFMALSATCTHLGCLVQHRVSQGDLACPCHGGRYDLDGRVLGGPPPGPLQRLDVKVVDGQLRRSDPASTVDSGAGPPKGAT